MRVRLADAPQPILLCVVDEFTRECLAIEFAKSMHSQDAILTLSRRILRYGKPQFIRSDSGVDFTATRLMK
ncbi:MAG TPA: hypothetical protein VFV64_05965 [Permianibacter sp.]|nr:hypothetical protein [Permianibacter sp.]